MVYGHHHLNTTNLDAQKKFFVDTLGGTLIKVGTNNAEIVKFPNVLIFFRATQAPTGGTRGTTVNHIGFSVPNLRPVIDKIKANGFKMITDTESPGRRGEGRHRRSAAARRRVDRLRAGAGRCEGGVRRGEAADDPNHAAPRALLQPEERRDAGLVREDVRREAARDGGAFRSRAICRASRSTSRRRPNPVVGTAGPRARSRRLRSQEPRGVHARSWKPTASR